MVEPWHNRKRERDEDIRDGITGFVEHRTKRRYASLPDRTSPKHVRHGNPSPANFTILPLPPTITPAESESEDTPAPSEPRSFFSADSSSPAQTITSNSPLLHSMNSPFNSQSTQMSDVGVQNDDMEMSDSSHTMVSTSISGRIPTPIHSSFAPYIRAEKATVHHESNFADDESKLDHFRRGRRLPSPISEGEISPSVIVEGLGEMQMDIEASTHDSEKGTPTKKGHNRSKHSLRSWTTGTGELGGAGAKRTFSMGYRSDCEKCRNRVPGHFNHIIAYD